MSIELNHTIVASHDQEAGAAFLTEVLGLPTPSRYGPFTVVEVAHGTSLDYLNQAHVQDALGVDLNYTEANNNVYYAFQSTGDEVYGYFLRDVEELLDAGIRVALYYGDADYICNWFGGEAISLAAKYADQDDFADAGYAKLMVDGHYRGDVRQYGRFSFTRVFESGHLVPYYQPEASLALFYRVINHLDVATGQTKITSTYSTKGPANSTHQEPFVPLPSPPDKPDGKNAHMKMGVNKRPAFHYEDYMRSRQP